MGGEWATFSFAAVRKRYPHEIKKNLPLLLCPQNVRTGSNPPAYVENHKFRKIWCFCTKKCRHPHLKNLPSALVRKMSALDNPLSPWLRTSLMDSPFLFAVVQFFWWHGHNFNLFVLQDACRISRHFLTLVKSWNWINLNQSFLTEFSGSLNRLVMYIVWTNCKHA